jgi:hypothetical protein
VDLEQLGRGVFDELAKEKVQALALGVQDQHAVTEQAKGGLCGKDHRVAPGTWSKRGRFAPRCWREIPFRRDRSSSGAVKPR